MRVKLDENLGHRVQELLRRASHDVATVAAEGLSSATDRDVIEVCQRERRCLVTLDLDFGNPLLFRPSLYTGIAVFRLPPKPSHADLIAAAETLILALRKDDIIGKLWIVQKTRVREYQEPREE